MTIHLRLEVGPVEAPTDLIDLTYSIALRRGLDLDGVTDELIPEAFATTLGGSETTNPLTNAAVRPTRPVRLRAGIEDTYGTHVTWHTIWTGKIKNGRIEHDGTAKYDPAAYKLQLTATDPIVPTLAGAPSVVAVSGSLAQRVAAVLDPTGVPYAVTDPAPAGSSEPLPTDATNALAQLRLIRDTLHASMYVDKAGVLQVVADGARPRVLGTPDFVATDADPAAGDVQYHAITPVFDTDNTVNVLTIRTLLGGGDAVEATYTDETSRAAWGDHPQTVTVNDGIAETHAGLYLATRSTPDLIPDRLAFLVDDREPTFGAHLDAACTLEIGDRIDVTRLGRTHELAVRELAHVIVAVLDPVPRLRWTVEVGLRVPDTLATRWDDVPADITWDDVPAGLTWDDAVNWHPYLLEGA